MDEGDLPADRGKQAGLEGDTVPAVSAPGPSESAPPREEGNVPGLTVASLGDVTVPLQRTPPTSQSAMLITRAMALIDNRDISSARLLLERAMAEGSAEAAFHLAETFDPRMLEAWRVIGPVGDPAKARHLYEQAASAQVAEARERLAGLP
jgi:TPR repeat protein